MQSPTEEPPKLDLHKFPICFVTNAGRCRAAYAFDRGTGEFSAAVGTLDHERVFGSPGDKVTVMVKRAFFEKGTPEPVLSFELPKNAKTIEHADLKSAYLRAMSEIGENELLKVKGRCEEELLSSTRKEAELSAKLSRQPAGPGADPKLLESIRSQLAWRGATRKCTRTRPPDCRD